jgi:hypothetical protein
VIKKTSNTALVTAMFLTPSSLAANKNWAVADAFVVIPQGRVQVVLDPAPTTAGDIIEIDYVKRPDPVYSPLGSYPFVLDYQNPLVYYAAFLYKYRDREPQYGDMLFRSFDRALKMGINAVDQAYSRNTLKVIMKGRRYG